MGLYLGLSLGPYEEGVVILLQGENFSNSKYSCYVPGETVYGWGNIFKNMVNGW